MANEKTYSRAENITVFWNVTPFSLLDVCSQRVGEESKKQVAEMCPCGALPTAL
jgi:hypothetical protein